jgi:hypothetical protein
MSMCRHVAICLPLPVGSGIVPVSSPAANPQVSTMASPADQASEIARLRPTLDAPHRYFYGNARMESSFPILKVELVHQCRWTTQAEARRAPLPRHRTLLQ